MSKNSGNSIVWKTVREIDHAATGKTLRLKRLSRGITMKSVAEKMGISTGYLSDMEQGFRNWTPEKVAAFEGAL